jgi:hypothetical protein
MGLFSRKRDSETDDLETLSGQTGGGSEGGGWQSQDASATSETAAVQSAYQSGATTRQAPIESYGFEQVAELMRALPLGENRDLVVRVFKKTLESVNISLEIVVEDANRKLAEISEKIGQVKQVILDLQQEVGARKKEAADLESQLTEIAKVKDLLFLAQGPNAKKEEAAADSKDEGDLKTRNTAPPTKPVFGSRNSKIPDSGSLKKY